MRYHFYLFFQLFFSSLASAGTIAGYIHDEEGNPLPYATIYVKENGSGTVANADAYYELKLNPGTYQLVYQFIGYKTEIKEVTVGAEKILLNIKLSPEAIVLREVKVKAGKEDPAYSIMRRAIAKAGFHLNRLDSFSAQVYIKGTGQVKDMPFFLRKTMEKEGIDTSRIFVSESLNEISFKRPDTYRERVLSVRSTGNDNNTNPNAYIFTSFYRPEIAKAITPLSPKAFAYYRFSYEGTFEDRGAYVSKIKVTPRSRGDNVFEGYLNIVEDLWSIHSLQLEAVKMGITFNINQIYAPVEDDIWMPISHKIMFFGSVLGFEFEYKYLASVSDYYLEKNPDLDYKLTVIDEKTEPELAREANREAENEEVEKLEELVATKTTTRKQLKKLVKEYEKIEKKREKEPEVVSRHYFKVDSGAYKMDSSYWSRIRPIPLSSKEVVGYQQVDSVAEVEQSKAAGDTLKASKSKAGFQVTDLLLGDRYKLADKTYLGISNVLQSINFNTVEGYNAEFQLSFQRTAGDNNNFIKLSPLVRYGFSREKFNGKVAFQYGFGKSTRRNDLILSGGRYIRQFNPNNPIHPVVNTLMTLFLERNYMKIYEQDFLSIYYQKQLSNKLNVNISGLYTERHELENNTSYNLINRKDVDHYLPNEPFSLESEDTGFPVHKAYTAEFNADFEPWIKYRVRNDKKYKIKDSSPVFSFMYRGARPFGDAVIDYDLVEIGFKHSFYNGIRGKLNIAVKTGKYRNNDKLYFMDYRHFSGNQTPLVTQDPVGTFRLLDYYLYSTDNEYLTAHAHYQFRKFLATQFTWIRMMGLRESLIVNYLATPTAEHYTEVGYSLDYILRIFRLEAVTSFRDGKYQEFGLRVGVTAGLFK